MPEGAFQYIPRKQEETVLYQVIAEQLETFLARQQERERKHYDRRSMKRDLNALRRERRNR